MRSGLRYWIPLFILLSYWMGWGSTQAVLMLAYSLAILFDDLVGPRIRRFDISTAYAFLLAVTSISHMIALFGLSDNPFYFTRFYSPEVSNEAIFIFNIGSIIIIETIRRIIKEGPHGHYTYSRLHAFRFWPLFLFSVSVFLVSELFPQIFAAFGSFGSFIQLIVHGSVLLLSFLAHVKNKHILFVFCYTFFLSVWALQYTFLRMEILVPWVAYLTGNLLAAGSIKGIHLYSKVFIISAIIIFPQLFAFLGENRSRLWGAQKLNRSIEAFTENEYGEIEGQSLMSRFSIIPQLSHIVRLTKKKGFYEGQTLNYLGYVFIPRFVWPEKPLIRQGQWFALEIGNAYEDKQGKINNSINMTVPGEFYLNFGWFGLIIGCTLFGVFIGWLWSQTNYHDLFGWVFRFYLLFLGLFSLGADLQIVPTLIAYFLIYKSILFVHPGKKVFVRRDHGIL